ncbi:hypothetical protein A2U01_0071763, partial [Trifolium medium]|nr:hypothetical protein [Trifolium medium]
GQQTDIVLDSPDEDSGFESAAEEEKSQDKVVTEEEELSGNGTENSQPEESDKIVSLDEEDNMSTEKIVAIEKDIVDVDDCDSIDQPLNKTFGGIAK